MTRRGGARPGSGRPRKGETRKSAGTRLTADERARIEAWGERRGMGFSEALREAALMMVDGKSATELEPWSRRRFGAAENPE